jgi:hypothetical protein
VAAGLLTALVGYVGLPVARYWAALAMRSPATAGALDQLTTGTTPLTLQLGPVFVSPNGCRDRRVRRAFRSTATVVLLGLLAFLLAVGITTTGDPLPPAGDRRPPSFRPTAVSR